MMTWRPCLRMCLMSSSSAMTDVASRWRAFFMRRMTTLRLGSAEARWTWVRKRSAAPK